MKIIFIFLKKTMKWKKNSLEWTIENKKIEQTPLFKGEFWNSLNVNWDTDLNIKLSVNNKSFAQVENRIKKNVNSIYSGRLLFFLLTAWMNYLRLKYWNDNIQRIFKRKYIDVNDFMDSVSFTDNIVLITFNTRDVVKFCNMNNLERFHKALKEIRENTNITLEDIVENIDNKSIYEGSLLADYYLNTKDKKIKFHINVKVLLAYLYKLTVKGYQNIKLSDINNIEGSVNELILYLNLAGKFKYKEFVYNVDTLKILFKKNDDANMLFVKFLQRMLKTMNKKNYPYLITLETIKQWRNIKQVKFKFTKNKTYQESMFDINSQNTIVWENLKEDIKQYFSQKYSVKLSESDINYIASEITIQWISLNDFVNLLPSNVVKQQIFDIIKMIKALNTLEEIFSNEEKTSIVKKLIANNRDLEYLNKWITYTKDNPRVENRKAYLISVINKNSEPTEYENKSTPKNFLKKNNGDFGLNFKINTVKL